MHNLLVRVESQVPAHVGVWLAPVQERAAPALLLHLHAGRNHQIACHTFQSESSRYITLLLAVHALLVGVGSQEAARAAVWLVSVLERLLSALLLRLQALREESVRHGVK